MFPAGYVVYKYNKLGSTNSQALRLINDSVINGDSVIIASEQTEGKGRATKTWLSPTGNIYLTFALKLKFDIQLISQFSFIAAVAVGEILDEVQYKWPNDLLISGKKVCGILLEHHGGDYLIVGIGVNVNNSPDYATCINEHYSFEVNELICEIVNNFHHEKKLWLKNGFARVRELWLEKAWGMNSRLKVKMKNVVLEGEFVGLDEEGSLLLMRGDGVHKIRSGEVFI